MSQRILDQDLRKQIGCMNGIFQLFDPNYFLAGRRMNGRSHKRLVQGAQDLLDPKYAPKVVMVENLEVQKEKSRNSMESSRPSNSSSSSSCSSVFSSLESNRTVKPESPSLRRIGMPETSFLLTAKKEEKCSLKKGLKFHDLQDVVNDSLHKQAHGLSVKCLAKDDKKGRVMKHIDSPRPLELPKNVKQATSFEGLTQVSAKLQDRTNSTKDERPALPRRSYDAREAREASKSTMKLRELPRLSLDSRASSIKCSALESRLDLELHMKNEKLSKAPQTNQELGIHNRSSSVVAKLMGLESFPDDVAPDENGITKIDRYSKEDSVVRSSSTAENSSQKHVSYSPKVKRNDPASPRLPNSGSHSKQSIRSRSPLEPASWRQTDSSHDSPKVAAPIGTASTNTQHLSSSVYGEIEKRITELEFKKSGKDLRALKRILEAMQKTRDRLESQRGESAPFTSHTRTYSLDESYYDQNHRLSMWHERKNHQQASTFCEHTPPNITDTSIVIMKPATAMERVTLSRSTQVSRIPIQHFQRFHSGDSNQYRYNSSHRQEAGDLQARTVNFNVSSPRDPSIEKKITRRTSNVEQTSIASSKMKVKGCNTFVRSSEIVSPRLVENRGRIERRFDATPPSRDLGRVKKHYSKKVMEKGSNASEHKIKSTNLHLSDDQFSEHSTETNYSSNLRDTASIKSEGDFGITSQAATGITSFPRSISTNMKIHENSVAALIGHEPTVELAATTMEQPSPVSVLDTTIYGEDSPSPIKKTSASTAFQDESPNPAEVLWDFKELDHLLSNPCYEYNQQNPEKIKHVVQELRWLKTKPDEATGNHTESMYVLPNQDHEYINKIILNSGLLKDRNFIPTIHQLHSSSHLINPSMFHILKQTAEDMDTENGELNRKSDWLKSSHKSHKKVVFDMVNEIFVSKIASHGSFTRGRRRVSPQALIKEIYSEVDRLQQKPESNLDEEDALIRILNADVMYQSEDWADYGVEVPALVLDIERLIFKDLVNEVVTSGATGLQNWTEKHRRQLFTN